MYDTQQKVIHVGLHKHRIVTYAVHNQYHHSLFTAFACVNISVTTSTNCIGPCRQFVLYYKSRSPPPPRGITAAARRSESRRAQPNKCSPGRSVPGPQDLFHRRVRSPLPAAGRSVGGALCEVEVPALSWSPNAGHLSFCARLMRNSLSLVSGEVCSRQVREDD